jgi:hypothetical protein
MAHFKVDEYYTAHIDKLEDVESSDSSSEPEVYSCNMGEIPRHLTQTRHDWIVSNYEVLEELWARFKTIGSQLFGAAFMQLADMNDFLNFVFTHTQPGAT